MENFDQLLEQYTPMIHKIISSLNIYKSREEYFQHGRIALWEAHRRFNPEKGKFMAYAYPYVKGKLMMEMSRENKSLDKEIYPDEDYWSIVPDKLKEDDAEILSTYCQKANLTNNQTKWVIYTFFFELKMNHIAKVENVSITAIKRWKKGALQNLRRFSSSQN